MIESPWDTNPPDHVSVDRVGPFTAPHTTWPGPHDTPYPGHGIDHRKYTGHVVATDHRKYTGHGQKKTPGHDGPAYGSRLTQSIGGCGRGRGGGGGDTFGDTFHTFGGGIGIDATFATVQQWVNKHGTRVNPFIGAVAMFAPIV